MSRKAVAFTLVAYLVAALAFATFEEIRSPTLAIPAYTLGALLGRAIGVFIPTGIIPVVVWAFFKFKAERAAGPLVLWAVLGVAFAYLQDYGKRADEAREIENVVNLTMTEKQRADMQSGVRVCAKAQGAILVSRQMITDPQIGPYPECFIDTVLVAMTREERRYLAETGKPPAGTQPKADQAATICLAKVKSAATGPTTPLEKDDEVWVDTPPPQR
jgi:hypothetical protein